jgi:DNA helicase-2/ATP-dependent DNA helicase PcrA
VTISFTAEQRALIEAAEPTFVEACPGAGKTQAIVQRFIERPSTTDRRRGVALLSFTNAAVDEARSRCTGEQQLLRAPNFVGTIDAFINRFIVAPFHVAKTGVAPTFRDTWSSVPGTAVSARSVPGLFSLDAFDVQLDGTAALRFERLPVDRRHGARQLRADQLEKLCAEASRIWRRQVDRGVVDAATSRRLMEQYLGEGEALSVAKELMAARFSEVIVDEVQDCTEADVVLLGTLQSAGVRLICVGDPDQAIYGFRCGVGTSLAGVLQELAIGARIDGNFRSSPAICSLVDSLRSGTKTDTAVGSNANIAEPVHVLGFHRTTDVKAMVGELLLETEIPPSNLVVLAHATSATRACAGAGSTLKSTDSVLVRFALAVHRVQQDPAAPAQRADGLRQIQRLIRELEGADQDEASFLESRGLTDRSFRDLCLRATVSLSPPFDAKPSQFKLELLTFFGNYPELGCRTSGLRKPNGDEWPVMPHAASDALPHSTIHGFKGLQARAVVLVLPKSQGQADDGVAQWIAGHSGENRRVLYVGASRAEQLLVLAVHESYADAVIEKLASENVDHVVWARERVASPSASTA